VYETDEAGHGMHNDGNAREKGPLMFISISLLSNMEKMECIPAQERSSCRDKQGRRIKESKSNGELQEKEGDSSGQHGKPEKE
jgi:hypothetical protein